MYTTIKVHTITLLYTYDIIPHDHLHDIFVLTWTVLYKPPFGKRTDFIFFTSDPAARGVVVDVCCFFSDEQSWLDTGMYMETPETIVVVVLTLTHNTMQSVVAGQAPITLEWKKYLK